MTEAEVDSWRAQFQIPDTAELAGADLVGPLPGWPGWPEWAADRWPVAIPLGEFLARAS